MDGTDCNVQEPRPWITAVNKTWYSHKFKRAGFRYEVAVCIQTCDIVWINGPFKCGTWADVKIFRRNLKQKLAPGEMVEADGGYKDDKCRVPDDIVSRADARAKDRSRSRHETINGKLKRFGCLAQIWRHPREQHKSAFAAVAVIVQLGIVSGEEEVYQVVY